jgi:hypothetical protein
MSDRPGESKLRTFWKGFTNLDARKDSCGSWKKITTSMNWNLEEGNFHE